MSIDERKALAALEPIARLLAKETNEDRWIDMAVTLAATLVKLAVSRGVIMPFAQRLGKIFGAEVLSGPHPVLCGSCPDEATCPKDEACNIEGFGIGVERKSPISDEDLAVAKAFMGVAKIGNG